MGPVAALRWAVTGPGIALPDPLASCARIDEVRARDATSRQLTAGADREVGTSLAEHGGRPHIRPHTRWATSTYLACRTACCSIVSRKTDF